MSRSIDPRTKKYAKGYRFLSFSFLRTFSDKYWNKILDTATRIGLDAAKTTSKKVVYKTAEATGEFTGNKIAEINLKPAENLKKGCKNKYLTRKQGRNI